MRKLVTILMLVAVVGLVASPASAITVHSSCDFGTTNLAGNTVDVNLNTYGTVSGTGGGWVVYDLGAATQFNLLEVVARNSTANIFPNGWTASIYDNDNPDTGNLVQIGSSNSLDIDVVREQYMRVTASNKQYLKFAWSGTHGTYSGYSEFNVFNHPSTKNVFASTKSSSSWPTRAKSMSADGNVNTYSNYNEGADGWVIVDLGSATAFDKVRITSRDFADTYFPNASKVYVYNNDDPLTGSEVEIGSGNLVSCNDGEYADLSVTESTKRYIKFQWTSAHGAGTSVNIAEIDVIPEPATMVLLGLGGIGLLIRRRRR